MPLDWSFAEEMLDLGGIGAQKIGQDDGLRQQETARSLLEDLRTKPGVILADEVGMGKTYVALAVVASVLLSTKKSAQPVVVMMPPGLSDKWQKEWEHFKRLCCRTAEALDSMRTEYAHTPTDFFRLLDDPPRKRARLIWMTTSCFNAGLYDGWIKLAFVRLARANSRLSHEATKRICWWITAMSRLKSYRGLTPECVDRLLHMKLSRWHKYLIRERVLDEDSDDPIPTQLLQVKRQLDWSKLAQFLREEIPGRQGGTSEERLREARNQFNDLCWGIYSDWLHRIHWRASLLVLDEAHHAKNDRTRLASLFRSEATTAMLTQNANLRADDLPLLWEKFDRMLFLTATPFQLGHQELMRVIRSFAAAKWTGPDAPSATREMFLAKLSSLEQRLSDNRLAGKRLDGWWGRIDPALMALQLKDCGDLAEAVQRWWEAAVRQPSNPLVEEIRKAIERCQETKTKAERDPDDPWRSLRSWVIRHNRPTWLPKEKGKEPALRREYRTGGSIAFPGAVVGRGACGIPLGPDEAAPFFVAARAQGELASFTGQGQRAFFAEGLCSSYEAFHHTREQRGDVREMDDEGVEHRHARRQRERPEAIIPISWYEEHVSRLIPSKDDRPEKRRGHPKISPVVRRTVDLWLSGEKVLIFCFYRQTAIALREHLREEVNAAIARAVAQRLGLDPEDQKGARERLESITRRLTDKGSPFHREVAAYLERQLEPRAFAALRADRDLSGRLVDMLAAYMRSPSYVSRYLPLDEPRIRAALVEGRAGLSVIREGARALRETLEKSFDGSGMSLRQRIAEFLRFVRDLAEKDRYQSATGEGVDAPPSQLKEYLDAISVYVSPRGEQDDDEGESRGGTFRALPVVRMVYGSTKLTIRQRIMLAFNSPMFPEILVSSAVLGEGVDLHRFCRYVIHHDLCWNPSTLEQRTGRLDRIRCKAELVRRPIMIYEPFIAGSADEKMYRVVKDRERWFQIVMGQKFEFDEKTSEELSRRVPLPESIANQLIFDLRRYR